MDLAQENCRHLNGPQHQILKDEAAGLLAQLPDWEMEDDAIAKTFRFANFDGAMAFANGVAWMAQREDHHPEMVIAWGRVKVRYSTHDVGGLSRNDFICAAKIEALLTLL